MCSTFQLSRSFDSDDDGKDNVTQQSLKLFVRITCPRHWPVIKLARVQVKQKLPIVISIGEVHTVLKLIEKPSTRCYFTVDYALGLRLQEASHLQVGERLASGQPRDSVFI
jgi:integrase